MKYRESKLDKDLRNWFVNDMTRALLHRINLVEGELRGLNNLDITFEYPVTAIAGRNGAGKSTVLALACCAFHNWKGGFKLPKRKTPYYTFSDFFVQHKGEVPPHSLSIEYSIAHNHWKPTKEIPTGIGIGIQDRWKVKGGKWNDYGTRVNRTVVFLGIERIVPHSERSQSRSYSKAFKDTPAKGWETTVKETVGYILSRKYDDFRYLAHSKYSLPLVKCGHTVYSGFNMGAGENALFEIFSTLYSAGEGALLVMDEIELGLHAEAQRRLIERLKKACLDLHAQVICTTHSKEIFECLPNDARFYIESVGGTTKVSQGISSEFAFAKLSSINGTEIDILVEDEVAKAILLATLPAALRSRAKFLVVGSATALARQLAAVYVRKDPKPILAIFDGDQHARENDNLKHAANMAENPRDDFADWYRDRIVYLPGDSWPEEWLLQKGSEVVIQMASVLGTDEAKLCDVIEYGRQAGKHNEFHEIAGHLGLERYQCLQHFTTVVSQQFSADLSHIGKKISHVLDG